MNQNLKTKNMKTICFDLPTMEDVEFRIDCENEDIPVRGNAVVSGNDEEDKEIEDSIIEQLNNGNEWAWCSVKVTASFKGIEGTDYLGGCSYADEKEFKEGGYYEDMKRQAYNELIEQLESFQS